MADVARVVRTSFWTSKMAMDMFSAEDTYFMLYLMTNPHTTQLGIYPINKKYMCIEFKHSIESINSLLDRFENKYKIIKYSSETNEIAIKNYLENSIIKGGKPVEDCLIKEISKVQDKNLLEFVYQYLVSCKTLKDTVVKILPLLHCVNDNDKENDNDNDNERYVDASYEEYNSEAANAEVFESNDVVPKKKKKTKKPTLELTEEEKNKFQTMVSFYPNQTHDIYKISNKQRKAILDTVSVDEMKRAIQRYVDSKEDWRYYKDISTWFLGAYIGYTDAEWNKSHPQDTLEKTPPDSDYDENGVRIRSR